MLLGGPLLVTGPKQALSLFALFRLSAPSLCHFVANFCKFCVQRGLRVISHFKLTKLVCKYLTHS